LKKLPHSFPGSHPAVEDSQKERFSRIAPDKTRLIKPQRVSLYDIIAGYFKKIKSKIWNYCKISAILLTVS